MTALRTGGGAPGAAVGGERALVVGLGRSGAAAAEALLDRGIAVRAVDAGTGEPVQARADALRARGADVRLGDLRTDALADRDLVVASPGVPPAHPLLTAAADGGLAVLSEPELAWRLADGRTRLIGVTGTNGKTTTTELVAACLGIPAGGNIGTPLVELLAAPEPPPLVAAELSSFQLHFTSSLRADVGVLLNVAPDHLDWHGGLDAYGAAKARLWARQRPTDAVVVDADDEGAAKVVGAHPPPGRVVRTSGVRVPAADDELAVGVRAGALVVRRDGRDVELVDVARLPARGPHELADVAAAVGAALALGSDASALVPALVAFRPGPHRLARIATLDGVDYVDDSKATNPHAAAAALAAHGTVVWIAGGLNKGLSFDELAEPVRRHVRTAVTIGSSGPEIAALARGVGVPVIEAGTLDRAVVAAAAAARPGDTVLLAPACASMDQFVDYAERGRAFAAAVAALAAPTAPSTASTPAPPTPLPGPPPTGEDDRGR